jgi:hypothetical protein
LLSGTKPDVTDAAAISLAGRPNTIVSSTASTMADYIDDAQAVISSQSGTFGALGAVLSKIDTFVNIVDQTANVCDKACVGLSCGQLISVSP